MHTKEELTPHALELFRRVQSSLPPNLSQRLRSMQKFSTHGSYRTLYLFDVWDSNQTDILSRYQFKYCLGYDHRPRATSEGYFHLWLNRVRIYRKRAEIVAMLDRELARVIPKQFRSHCNDRAFDYKYEFAFPKNLKDLPDLLLPHYLSLISTVHPVLMPIIDQFTTPLEPGERRAVVASRGRVPFTLPGVHDRTRVREYTRSVPPSWRAEILEEHGYRCARCKCDLRQVQYHMDHIKPFSKEGATTRDNLQPLCGPCNLSKGNRE